MQNETRGVFLDGTSKNGTLLFFAAVILVLLAVGLLFLREKKTQGAGQKNTTPEAQTENVRVHEPRSGMTVTSPLEVTGEARGTWFFEASFPLVLVDWDGKIIAQGYASAILDPDDPESTWMTGDFVLFSGTLEFATPYEGGSAAPDFMRRGTLILQKDNPSGLTQYDDAVEVSVLFE